MISFLTVYSNVKTAYVDNIYNTIIASFWQFLTPPPPHILTIV